MCAPRGWEPESGILCKSLHFGIFIVPGRFFSETLFVLSKAGPQGTVIQAEVTTINEELYSQTILSYI